MPLIKSSRQMHDAMKSQIELLECLIRIFSEEKSALEKREPELVLHFAQDKENLTCQIEELDNKCKTLLQNAGYSTDAAGMETYVYQCDAQDETSLVTIWKDLQTLIAECRTHNQVNGGIVELSKHNVERALAILRGQTSSNQNEGYDTNGKAHNGLTPQSLAKA